MRNKYPGVCYFCGKMVPRGEGHPEKHDGKWRVVHVQCVFDQRKEKVNKNG